MYVKTQRRAQNGLPKPQALREPPAQSPLSGWRSPQALVPQPENSLNTKNQQLERPKQPCFRLEEQGTRAKAFWSRRVAGGWGGCRGSAGLHRALACSPAPGAAQHTQGLAPRPFLRAFGSSPCFFSTQKKPQTQVTLQSIICWLLAGCSETVTEAPLASSTPFNRLGKAWMVISCGTQQAGNVNCFYPGASGTSGVSTPTHGQDMGTCCSSWQERRGHLGHLHPGMRGTTPLQYDHDICKSLEIDAFGAWELILMG